MTEGERRLAAIMFTDIVGYTALTQTNESLAIKLLEKHRKLIRPILSKYRGIEVKTMGDGFLVEFGSALAATECAVEMQKVLHEYNGNATEKVLVRVGIHVGDVVHSEGDVLGDAVNIASRIEPLALGGEICISEQVYAQVRNKIPFRMLKINAQELKNIAFPIDVYKLQLPWETDNKVPEVGYDKHRIAVLPLVNMIADPNDEYFADGMTEELISIISKIKELTVISRTSVMKFKGVGVPMDELGKTLRVGSAIEGSVRKSGNRARIAVQLIDVNTDSHLWSQSYDRELNDVFAIQSEIAQHVADALKVQLLSSEKTDIERRGTESAEAHTLYLKGLYYLNERKLEGTDKAVRYFEEAIKQDSQFALAYAGMAECYLVYSNYGWRAPKEAYPLAKEYSMKAIAIDPRLAEPHASLGAIYAHYEYRWHEAEAEFKRAMALKASYARAYHWYSLVLRIIGRPNESYEQIKRAYELDPLSWIIGLNVGEVLLVLGRPKEAAEQYLKVLETNPDAAYLHIGLAWSYYFKSRIADAVDEIRRSIALSGDDPDQKAQWACLLGFCGKRQEANAIIEELSQPSETTYVNKVSMAMALIGVGRIDEAFSYLEKGYVDRSDTLLFVAFYPWFKEFRKDPRWLDLFKRFGIPEI
ncbi:MAG: tetratricopeptide repeat protein [Thaumarchaeota archaeon]|nr:tetratricopeptide repeat protein [Nitrososphaerota archaeon]